MRFKNKFQYYFSILLKIAVFGLFFWFLRHHITNLRDELVRGDVLQRFDPTWLEVAFLLMPLNWLIESWKWKQLSEQVNPISFVQSFKGVMSGVALSMVAPFGIGDYAGKVGYVHPARRLESLVPVFIGRGLQMSATLLFGLLGLKTYLAHGEMQYKTVYWYYIAGVLLLTLAFWVLFHEPIQERLRRLRLWIVPRLLTPLKNYSTLLLIRVWFLCVVRYLVFALQFYLVFLAFDFDLPPGLVLSGITWIFLFKSLIPSLSGLYDLGTREVATVVFFSAFDASLSVAIAASLLLWAVNILIPALIGLIFVFWIKIFATPDDRLS